MDYVQLLMISWVIRATKVDWNAKKAPYVIKKWNAHFWIMFNFWWSAERSEQWKSTKMQNRPLCHQKMKCSFLDYVQLLMIGQAIWATIVNRNARKWEKDPLSHWKMKSSFLDYVQLLMNGWAIWATKINQNAKKWNKRPPKSSKNKMFIFGLHSTSDDQPSDLSDKRWLKHKKKKKNKKQRKAS